jgi:hypothetical protein
VTYAGGRSGSSGPGYYVTGNHPAVDPLVWTP